MVASVAELVTHLHSNIDSIHKCIEALSSTEQHDAEMQNLERRREEMIEEVRRKFEAETAEAEGMRKNEAEELLVTRKREEDELAERRRREDMARQAKIEEEERERAQRKKQQHMHRERQVEIKRKEIQEQIERELERLEDELESRVEEGKKQLVELDEKRKAINAQIDAALNTPLVIPTVKFRSRAKTAPRAGAVAMTAPRSNEMPAVTLVSKSSDAEADIASSESHSIGRVVPAPEVEVLPEEFQKTVDAEKAWWKVNHLTSKTPKPNKKPAPVVSIQTPNIRNSLSERSANTQEVSIIPEVERIQVNAQEAAEFGQEVQESIASKKALYAIFDASNVYHFSEKDRPHPVFKSVFANTQLYHFSETSRPQPTFIYRFSESRRPSPEFNDSNDAPKLYHFSEENRPYPGFVQRDIVQQKPNLVPGTYRFSEQTRPQPRFLENTEVPKTYRFSEHQRPTPTFIYRFLEESRPRPIFVEQVDIPKISRFSEENRPGPSFRKKLLGYISLTRKSGTYRFSENCRPQPSFSTTPGMPNIFRFSEQQRPKPTFTYRFSEESRPRPIFVEQIKVPELYHFFEGMRPSPVFEEEKVQAISPLSRLGVYSFSEDYRPRPVFISNAVTPFSYHFSEWNRPMPQFFYNFSEEKRPLPRFTEESQVPEIFHFSEETRPSPVFEKQPRETKYSPLKSRSTASRQVYYFTEEERPQPTFSSQAAKLRVFRFSEEQRPIPSFIHRFSEDTRPKPLFDLQQSQLPIYHFSEDQRPAPHFDTTPHFIVIMAQKSLPEKKMLAGVHHFSEEDRPLPRFAQALEEMEVYRFSEETRPLPSFVYRFSEARRPSPKLEKHFTDYTIHRFLEIDRPKPAFEHMAVMAESVFCSSTKEFQTAEVVAHATNFSLSRNHAANVYHFSESSRPGPICIEQSTRASKTYHFSEDTRPKPSLIYRFSEERRPLPTYNQEATPDRVHRFLEADRPRPSLDDDDSAGPPETTREPSSHSVVENHIEAALSGLEEQPHLPASLLAESTVHGNGFFRGGDLHTSKASESPKEEDEEDCPKQLHQRKSSILVSLANAIGSDVPLVSRLVQSQEYTSVAPDDYEPYSDDVREPAEDEARPQVIPDHSDWQPNEEFDEGISVRRIDTSLHIKTYNADIVSEFDSYPHSDEEDSPTTPSDATSSPFVEIPEEPIIHSAWSPPRGDIHHREEVPAMKPQASPLRAHFEHTYSNYMAPQASLANFRTTESPASGSESGNSDEMDEREALSKSQQFDRRPYESSGFVTQSLDGLPRTNPPAARQTSIFEKTRSLFEASSEPQPQPNATPSRPRSSIFNMTRTSPSPSQIPVRNRPTSLYQPQTGFFPEEVMIPKSLDGNGNPPSPAFVLPSDMKRFSQANGGMRAERKTFLDGLTRLVGSGGLDSSAHNPATEKLLVGEDRW